MRFAGCERIDGEISTGTVASMSHGVAARTAFRICRQLHHYTVTPPMCLLSIPAINRLGQICTPALAIQPTNLLAAPGSNGSAIWIYGY